MKKFSQKNIKKFTEQLFDLVVFTYEDRRIFSHCNLNAFQILEDLTTSRCQKGKVKILICKAGSTINLGNNIEDYKDVIVDWHSFQGE